MLTPDEYVARSGIPCPACGSSNIEGGDWDSDVSPSQAVTCLDCQATWTDTYTLTGYTDLELSVPLKTPEE